MQKAVCYGYNVLTIFGNALMKTTEQLPTLLAIKLGEDSDLIQKQESGMDYDQFNDAMDRMRYFQQMAVTSRFEDCVAAYYGMKLSESQLSVLKLIHRTTKPWMTGHIVGVCMERIDSAKTQNKDFAESVRVLVEQLGEKEDGNIGKKMNGIMVKSTRTEKAAQASK